MSKAKLIRLQVTMPASVHRAMKAIARRENETLSDIIRRALVGHIASENDRAKFERDMAPRMPVDAGEDTKPLVNEEE